ncbi:MAG: DUF2281 domain-containing protein [Anaerolineales bacterium]
MFQEQILQSLNTLPPAAQREVLDFIAFLQTRYKNQVQSEKIPTERNLSDEPFVGMWQDRDDMQDSSAWVRKVRTQEWE